jgi:ribosome recycling factor
MNEKIKSVQNAIEDFEKEALSQIKRFKDKTRELDPTKTDPDLISNIIVDIHGKKSRVKDLAVVSSLQGRVLEIRVFDRSFRHSISEAISHQGPHFSNISTVGENLLLRLEPVTGDYLLNIFKSVKEEAEHIRTIIRDLRRKAQRKIEETFNDKENINKNKKLLQDSFEKKNEEITAVLETFKKNHIPKTFW